MAVSYELRKIFDSVPLFDVRQIVFCIISKGFLWIPQKNLLFS